MSQSNTKHVATGKGLGHIAAATGAELVGSLLIFLVIYLVSAIVPALYGPSMMLILLATAFAYAAMTLIFGRLSGGQFNPAVTLAAMLTGKTHIIEGICYIIAQVLGAIASGAIVRYIVPTSSKATLSIWFTSAVNGFDKGSLSNAQLSQVGVSFGPVYAIVVESLAALIIVAVAMRTMNGKTDDKSMAVHAIAMGCAYAAGVALTYPATGSSLNPARATGIALFAKDAKLPVNPTNQLWLFWICPIFAAAVVAVVLIVAQMMHSDEEDEAEVATVDPDFDAAFATTDTAANANSSVDTAAETNDSSISDAYNIDFNMNGNTTDSSSDADSTAPADSHTTDPQPTNADDSGSNIDSGDINN